MTTVKSQNGFVGMKTLASSSELEGLLRSNDLATEPSYYFLRWFHKVSGIVMQLPDDFPSPEGQLFNSKRELRWHQCGEGYEVLLLTQVESDLQQFGFEPISQQWEVIDRNAYWYPTPEVPLPSKFPKEFVFKDAEEKAIAPHDIAIAQRYFRDAQTLTVHFVALTVRN